MCVERGCHKEVLVMLGAELARAPPPQAQESPTLKPAREDHAVKPLLRVVRVRA